jgi:hypothetical protein
LSGVRIVDSASVDKNNQVFKIGCSCGRNESQLLGYPVESQALPGEDVFAGPLSIQCQACGKRTMFFDSEIHGYDGENDSSAAMSGTGDPLPWSCPSCQGTSVSVEVQLVYNVEPDEEMLDRSQDIFSEISVVCKCGTCGKSSIATSIDCI